MIVKYLPNLVLWLGLLVREIIIINNNIIGIDDDDDVCNKKLLPHNFGFSTRYVTII